MGKLDDKIQLIRAVDVVTFFVVILFVFLFANSIVELMGAMQSEVYTNIVAGISKI